MHRTWSLASVLILVAGLASAAAPPSRFEIQLLDRRFTPAEGVGPAAVASLAAQAGVAKSAGASTVHALVQLHQVPDATQRLDLWRRGLGLGGYVSGNAWMAAVPSDQVGRLGAMPEIRWLAPWTADLKVHPRLKAGEIGEWAIDPTRPDFAMFFVQLHHDVDLGAIERIAADFGGAAMPAIDGLHGATVWLPVDAIAKLAGREEVLWIEEGPMPLEPNNDGVRAQTRADAILASPYNLTGTGVRLFVFDGGTVRATHETFNPGTGSRVTVIDSGAAADHPTHVAGTAGGDGSGSTGGKGRGVATGASILSAAYQQTGGTMLFWDNAGDIQADYALARNTYNADLGTNSIGSNTASNGYNCAREGDYGVSSNMLDGIVRGDNATVGSAVVMTWANGNERSGGSPKGRCGANYVTTAPPSCAKNPIHVGALNSDGGSMTNFSSWGPCDDGRMKPVVSAPGCESGRVSGETFIYSSLNTSNSAYGGSGWCGTSMATPAAAGIVSLFLEDWRALGHGGANARPQPSLVKAMTIHTAKDLGQAGPDYIYGYGAIDAQALVDHLRAGTGALGAAGPAVWGTDSVAHGAVDSFTISVPAGTGELKASLAWDDPAAAAFSANAAVNNLTLQLVSPTSTVHDAFVLSAANPHLPATIGLNGIDNQEQVIVVDPAAGTWTVRVTGTNVPTGPQGYGLAYTAKAATFSEANCTNTALGFESGNDGFTLSGAARLASPAAGHGSFSLRLGGTASTTHDAYRDVVVPAGAPHASLSYWWYMTTAETATQGFGWDFFQTEIRSSTGTVLSVVDNRSDGWRQAAWMQQQNVDLTPWAGQTIRVAFRATNDSSLATTFWADDLAIKTCTGGGGGNTPPTVTITAPTTGASFTQGTSVGFTGTATDVEDGTISASLAWSSSLDGAIGTGASFSTSTLSVGTHTITASVTDSGGLPDSDQIQVTITSTGPVTVTLTSVGAEDGYISESGETTNVGGSNGSSSTASTTSALRVGDRNNDRQYRSIVSFDTSSIPDGATITAVTLRLKRGSLTGTSPFTTHGSCTIDIHSTGFGGSTAYAIADFQAAATATGVATMSHPTTDGTFSTGALNAAGMAAVNKTGRTQLKVYMTLDDNDDSGNDYMGFYSGEAAAGNKPELVVTYTP